MPTEHGREPDIDAAFDDIVAHWSEPAVEPERPTPSTSSLGSAVADRPAAAAAPVAPVAPVNPAPTSRPAAPSGVRIPSQPDEGEVQQHFGHRGYTVPDEPEEDFVPAAPAPMPDPDSDPQFWAIVGCLSLGPLLLLGLVLTGRTGLSPLVWLGAALTLVGFALLVARGGRTPRDPGDDGARV